MSLPSCHFSMFSENNKHFCRYNVFETFFTVFSLRMRAELAMHSWDKLNQLQLMFRTWPHQEIMNILSTFSHYLVVVDIIAVVLVVSIIAGVRGSMILWIRYVIIKTIGVNCSQILSKFTRYHIYLRSLTLQTNLY